MPDIKLLVNIISSVIVISIGVSITNVVKLLVNRRKGNAKKDQSFESGIELLKEKDIDDYPYSIEEFELEVNREYELESPELSASEDLNDTNHEYPLDFEEFKNHSNYKNTSSGGNWWN